MRGRGKRPASAPACDGEGSEQPLWKRRQQERTQDAWRRWMEACPFPRMAARGGFPPFPGAGPRYQDLPESTEGDAVAAQGAPPKGLRRRMGEVHHFCKGMGRKGMFSDDVHITTKLFMLLSELVLLPFTSFSIHPCNISRQKMYFVRHAV